MDIFDYAMKMEKDGEGYYREIAGKCGNKGLKNILTMLADEEVKHFEILRQMKTKTPKLTDTDLLSNVKNVFEKMKDSKESFNFDASQKEFYKKAQQLEKQSEELYLGKSKELTDKAQKEIFLKIADEEKRHFFILENIIEFISRPETWLEDAEFYKIEKY
jgi:rubrerythrin